MLWLRVVVVGVMSVIAAGEVSVPLLWAQLLVDMRRHLVGACLFLLDADTSTGISSAFLLVTMQKFLASHGVPLSIHDVSSPEPSCGYKQQLVAVFPGTATRLQIGSGWWIVLGGSSQLIGSLEPRPGSRLLLAQLQKESRLLLTEVLHYHSNRRLIGVWESKGKIDLDLYQQSSLNGVTLRASTVSPEDMNKSTTLREIWEILERRINFTTELSVPEGRAWGSEENGSWTGLIGLIQRGEADVGLNTALVTSTRMNAVDFSIPIFYSRFCIYIKQPNSLELVWTNFLEPFSSTLWLAIMALILIAGVYVTMLGKLSTLLPQNYERHSLLESIHLMFGVFCQQGHSVERMHSSCRMVYLWAYLCAVVVLTAYSAANISFLTVQRRNLPFEDVQGLLQDGRYPLGMLAKSDVPSFFKNSNESSLQKVYERLIRPMEADLPPNQLSGLQRTCSERFAFMMPCQLAGPLLPQLSCIVTPLPTQYFNVLGSLVFTKNSSYIRAFNYYLGLMRMDGILNKLRLLETPPTQSEDMSFLSVTLRATAPVFAMLVLATCLALLFLSLERFFWLMTSSKHPPSSYEDHAASTSQSQVSDAT